MVRVRVGARVWVGLVRGYVRGKFRFRVTIRPLAKFRVSVGLVFFFFFLFQCSFFSRIDALLGGGG